MDLFSQAVSTPKTESTIEPVQDTAPKEPTFYRENFKKELAKLNKEQRQAVETIEGPVLVIAGPGTGKTQILAARIGYILENADARPENILCLTYTDAGAIAMRKRLVQFIGPEAYRLTINTFHAFCNNIIQDNLDLFGIHDLELISDLEVNEILRTMIDSLPLDHPLKRVTADPYFERKRMRDLFRNMKNEAWTPEYIATKADEYIASLPEREEYRYKSSNASKGYKKGDLKASAIKQETERMEQLKAAAREFPRYVKTIAERKRYDFDDMLLWMHDAFEKNPDLLMNYQERYQYVLVDEFQDTNGIQNQILQQLIGYWENPNVFVVGDDDQSIFRFQGANVQNIMQFCEQFSESKPIIIKENYRSSQHILDVAKALINRNSGRLINVIEGLTKDIIAKGENASFNIQPEIREYPSVDYESLHIAQEIIALKDKGVNPGSIAVIYRKHKQVEDLARFLEINDVSVNLKRRMNVLNATLVNHIITILQYVDAETKSPRSGEHLLFDILHFDIFRINPLVIARIALEIRLANKERRNMTWREEIKEVAGRMKNELFDEHDDESYRAIKKLSADIEYWISEAKNLTVQQLLEKIVTRGGILKHIMHSPDKLWLMQELTTFFNFVKAESAKNPRINISKLVHLITMMRQDEIELPISKISYAENGVNLLTAHSSKGLEFEYVFLMGCTKDAWEKGGRGGGYSLPDNLVAKYISEKGDEQEESRRLFYVALTRAKKYLYISYHTADKNMVDQPECRFVGEIVSSTGIKAKKIEVSDDALVDFHNQLMTEKELPVLQTVEEARMRKALENYSLSATHLNEYLRCPVSFYFKYILRVPTAKSEYLAFGTAVHYALEQLARKMLAHDDKQFPGIEVMLSDFERSMYWEEESFTPDQFVRRLDYGKTILTAYYNQYVPTWNHVLSPERYFRDVVVNGVPIHGKMDKVEFDGNLANVVDYKTGDPKKGQKKLMTLDGDYWRQAVFYRILLENDKTVNWKFASAEIDFIQPDEDGKFHKHRIAVDDLSMGLVKDQIRTAYDGILNLEFKRACNDKWCDWCNFVKSRYQSVTESEEVTEE